MWHAPCRHSSSGCLTIRPRAGTQQAADTRVDGVHRVCAQRAAPGPGQGAVTGQACPALLHGHRLVRVDEVHCSSGGGGGWRVPRHHGIPVSAPDGGHGAGRRQPRRRCWRRDGSGHWGRCSRHASRRHHPRRRGGAHAWGWPVLLQRRHAVRRREARLRVAEHVGRRWPIPHTSRAGSVGRHVRRYRVAVERGHAEVAGRLCSRGRVASLVRLSGDARHAHDAHIHTIMARQCVGHLQGRRLL